MSDGRQTHLKKNTISFAIASETEYATSKDGKYTPKKLQSGKTRWVEVEVMGLLDRGGDTVAVQSMGTVIYAMSIKLAQTSSISAGTLRLALSFAG